MKLMITELNSRFRLEFEHRHPGPGRLEDAYTENFDYSDTDGDWQKYHYN